MIPERPKFIPTNAEQTDFITNGLGPFFIKGEINQLPREIRNLVEAVKSHYKLSEPTQEAVPVRTPEEALYATAPRTREQLAADYAAYATRMSMYTINDDINHPDQFANATINLRLR